MVNLKTLSEIQGSGQPESKRTELSARKWAFSQCQAQALLTWVERPVLAIIIRDISKCKTQIEISLGLKKNAVACQ